MPTRTNREYRLFMRAFPLPPGSYKVSNIKMTGGTDITLDMATYIMDAKSDIRFDIVPGQTTYIGRMEWAPIYHKAFLGIPLFTGWHYEITDASEQDMAVLIGKVPALPPAKSQLVPTAGMKPWIN